MSIQISVCNLLVCCQPMQDEHGETALFTACDEGRYDLAALLIDHRTDVNYLSKVRPHHTSVVNMVEWCAQFRARCSFAVIMYLVIMVCGSFIHVEIIELN